jgi:hypothetical protein
MVASDKSNLIDKLRQAGLSRAAIDAAWPSWWNDEASNSPSGRAELRFALARRLGLEARPLLGERVEFIWNDEARFKHLSTQDASEQSLLTSYGIAIGRLLLRATPQHPKLQLGDAQQLRAAILASHQYVDLQALVAASWALGIPIVHLRVFPLEAKSMHAMVVSLDGRYAVLLGRDASYPAPVAFTLAHELGHIALQHLAGSSALVDLEDSATAAAVDEEEREADKFALALLTGSPDPDIQTNLDRFSARSLAQAVLDAGPKYRVEPGTLSLCLAHRRNIWPIAAASLRHIYAEAKPVWKEINAIAFNELDWTSVGEEGASYLRNVLDLPK